MSTLSTPKKYRKKPVEIVLAGFAIPPNWNDESMCASKSDDTFYPDASQDGIQAKLICAVCPVLHECREWALSTGEEYGVWGGMTERERRKLLTLQKRGAA